MEFGFIDDCSSTTTETETSERRASDLLRGGVFETWLSHDQVEPERISTFSEVSPVIQVVPPIIRKYHKPPSKDRISLSSCNTVLIHPDLDSDDDESILMPFIGNHEFDGKFPSHIVTVENEKMIAMSNPQTLSILPTVQETPKDNETSSMRLSYTEHSNHNHTPSHSRSPSSHYHHEEDDELTDTEILTDTEELLSDRDPSNISWTDEGDNETETVHEEAHYLDHYFEDEETEKREAETSFNLKRAPNRKSLMESASVHSSDLRAPSPRPRLSESTSLNRRPNYVDYLASSPKHALSLLEKKVNPAPGGEMTSYPQVVPHFDDTHPVLPMDVYFEHKQHGRTPSDRSPSLTPMDKLLEQAAQVPLPSKQRTSLDSFYTVTHHSSQFKVPPANSSISSAPGGSALPSTGPSSPRNTSTSILLCKVEPEKKDILQKKQTLSIAMQLSKAGMQHERQFSDVDFSDMLSDEILTDFEAGLSHEVQSDVPFLTMLVNERQDIRIRVIE